MGQIANQMALGLFHKVKEKIKERFDKDMMLVNGKEYTVKELLGKGKGGYSYLVTDGNQDYVLKQIHHEPCDYYEFGDKLTAEQDDYRRLTEIGIRMPRMLDVDLANERILKEYVEGVTIFNMVLEDKPIDEYIKQMREMCCRLYPVDINIDYFPTNFVVQDGIMYYIDYECNAYSDEWNFENWGIKYWSKTPEFLAHVDKLRKEEKER